MDTFPPKPARQADTSIEATNTPPPVARSPMDPTPVTLELESSGRDAREASLPHRVGDYIVLGVLGEGGMGTVYLAEDARLGRKAAIKTMKAELAAKLEYRLRFVREARATAAVEHDHIVPIWQVGETADGSPFIAMPFLQGEMLEDRLKREPICSTALLLTVACHVASGLAAAHARGLIHRDIKPSNVWLEGDPTAPDLTVQVRRCKILDFGLARSLATEPVGLTTSGTILGTPGYMAPEQACGDNVDHRADLFSLGVMLYRMATGNLPFQGPHVLAVLSSLATVTPTSARTHIQNLPQELSDLIDRLMCKDPAGRPPSAAEVAEEVRRIGKDWQMEPLPLPSPPSATPALPQLLGDARPGSTVRLKEADVPTDPDGGPATAVLPTGGRRKPWTLIIGILALVPLAWLLVTLLPRDTEKGPGEQTKGPDAQRTGVDQGGSRVPDPQKHQPMKAERARGEVTPNLLMNIHPQKADGLALERKAAEFVLSLGGTVRVSGRPQLFKAVAELPQEPFQLTEAHLGANKRVSNDGLACFKGCKHLLELDLSGTAVSDVGLTHFQNCKGLTTLHLNNTPVTDGGVVAFKGCKELTFLNLSGTCVTDGVLALVKDWGKIKHLFLQYTEVGDAGLAYLKDCKYLAVLDLNHSKVGDAGLAHIEGLESLTGLTLNGTQVSDVGLSRLKGCKRLAYLTLDNTRVSDAGMTHCKDYQSLTALYLHGTKVGDEGLAHFKGGATLDALGLRDTPVSDDGLAHLMRCKGLKLVQLQGSKVTAAGVAKLLKALPSCKIEWDGGVVDPKAN